jgi:DNA/RNA-binding domain of Phe-tRNA-synthetase-like protein
VSAGSTEATAGSPAAVTLRLEAEVLERFPALSVGGFAVAGVDRAAAALDEAALEALWAGARSGLETAGARLETVAELPRVRAWRQAFAACGVKPSTYRSSVEALVRRVLKDGAVQTPIPAVTAYCALSVRHLAPLGGYDADRLPAPEVAVRPARPGAERFSPLGGRAEDMPLDERVVVYASGDEVICWSFNHRDSRDTCLLPETRAAVFFGEALAPDARADVAAALEELRSLFTERGARATPVAFADASTPVLTLSPG